MWYPLRLRPVESEYVWGREISCNPGGQSVIDNGDFNGIELSELIDLHCDGLLGTAAQKNDRDCADGIEFPFLLKLIDAKDMLPVLAHGCRKAADTAGCKEDRQNKVWYVVSAAPGAQLALGLIPDISREGLFKKAVAGTICDCLNYIDIAVGDVFCIPAGLVHAGGKGAAFLEIQARTSPLYTFYDYDRVDGKGQRTPLSLIKAIEAADCQRQGEKYAGLEITINEMARKTVLAATQFFAAELYVIEDETEEETDGSSFHLYFFTEGETIIEHGSNFLIARKGETILVPAELGAYGLKGKFRGLKLYVPDSANDVVQPLKKAGYSSEEIKKNICSIGGV